MAALLLVLAPADARGQTPAGLVRVDSVVVRGVDRLTAADVAGASGIRTGALHNWLDVNRALKNIWATGQHEDLAARMETVDGRNTLVLEVVERPLARIVRIAGLESVSDDDVFGNPAWNRMRRCRSTGSRRPGPTSGRNCGGVAFRTPGSTSACRPCRGTTEAWTSSWRWRRDSG